MCGEVMVQEKLPAEEEEGDVVYNPYDYEEAARIPQTMSDGCVQR